MYNLGLMYLGCFSALSASIDRNQTPLLTLTSHEETNHWCRNCFFPDDKEESFHGNHLVGEAGENGQLSSICCMKCLPSLYFVVMVHYGCKNLRMDQPDQPVFC